MFEKLAAIRAIEDDLSFSEFQFLMDRWDDELTDYMRSAEKHCNQRRGKQLDWSPEVGVWLSRRWLLKRIQKWMDGKTRDPRNLFRSCRNQKLKDPREMTPHELAVEMWICTRALERLEKLAPKKRREHLQELRDRAQKKLDRARRFRDDREVQKHEEKVRIINNIIQRERSVRRWGRIGQSTKKFRGQQVVSVRVPRAASEVDPSQAANSDPASDEPQYDEFDTEDGVFDAVSAGIASRYRLARSAPAYSGQLFNDLGFVGDTAAAAAILEGTYVFPPNLDPATRLLLEEAARTFALLSRREVSTYVTVEDFQYYWKRARERTSSSYSGLSFSHYMAAAHDDELSLLHASKLSACAAKGVPLSRWGIGVTVLLEKICGNNFMHRLRAICLFEADFNWWQKLVFARRMMKMASSNGLIPEENFAKQGSHCNYAIMTKKFFVDSAKILHHPAALGQDDFGDCYDRTAHGPKSIALQAWGIPKEAVRLLLHCIQLMNYCLKTGFGESERRFGGTPSDRLAGSCQGSGSAPAAWSAISALIVNAYKEMGYGAKMVTPYTARLFVLAAVLYVDDTDMLHWADNRLATDEELLAQAQDEVDAWAHLAQATGAILKQEKCSIQPLLWKFVRGRARMKHIADMPEPTTWVRLPDKSGKLGPLQPSHISIPQPDGSRAPIATLNPDVAAKMLGYHFAPFSDSSDHVDKMVTKGIEWCDQLTARPLPPRDAWFSFENALYLSMSWGLVAVVLEPSKLENRFQSFYYRALPLFNVNRNIKKEWRMLPPRFQGLGLPNWNVKALGAKMHFLQCTWGLNGAASNMMRHNYETFLLEVGVYGNVFSAKYSVFCDLIEDGTWFKHLWQLLDMLRVRLVVSADFQISPVRTGDRSIMDMISAVVKDKSTLQSVQVVRHDLGVVHLSDILRCDGRSVDPLFLGDDTFPAPSDRHTFPLQQPTRKDYETWRTCIQTITSSSFTAPFALGPFIQEPHRDIPWRTTDALDIVYRRYEHDGRKYHDVLLLDVSASSPRRRIFRWTCTSYGLDPGTRYASVDAIDEMSVQLHSSAALPMTEPIPQDFWSVLHSFPNQSLWKNFVCDGDGEWIHRGLVDGTLVVSHDGSFMEHVSSKVSSGAFMIYCRRTGSRCKGSVVEYSEDAGNYRAEILAGIMAQLVLRAASRRPAVYPPQSLGCDNKGVVFHGNDPTSELCEKQTQADVLRVLKTLINEQPFSSSYVHVDGHVIRFKKWKDMTLDERMNESCDILAKKALMAGFATDDYIDSCFPFEHIFLEVDGQKVTGSATKALERHWGTREARSFFNSQQIIDTENFHLVYWDGMEKVMSEYPRMFRNWVTKHVAECCGTNLQLSYWNKSHSPMCPCCGTARETTMHITRCQSEGRREMLRLSVRDLADWMASTLVDPALVDMVERYLLAQGELSWREALEYEEPDFVILADVSDRLGWDCFVEGRIASYWLQVMKPILTDSHLFLNVERWARQFMTRLLGITHKQWIFRNSKKHFRRLDGLTEAEHEEIFRKLERYSWWDPGDLLPKHRHLLEVDFEALAEGTAVERQFWIVSMESAVKAATRARVGLIAANHLGAFQRRRHRRPARRSSPGGSIVYRYSRTPRR